MSDLDEKTEELMLVRKAKQQLEAELKEAVAMESELKRDIISLMSASGLEAFRNSHCQITKKAVNTPRLEDYDALVAYMHETKGYDLFQKRLAVTAVRERWDAGIVVPGVGVSHDVSITVREP